MKTLKAPIALTINGYELAMDQAAQGASALSSKDFPAAVNHYTNAIAVHSEAVDYYIKRSTAYTRISPPNHHAALSDAEIALSLASKRGKRELIIQAQLRRAIALFGHERYGDSRQCFDWVRKMDEKEKSLKIWEMKLDAKLKGMRGDDEKATVTVKQFPDVDLPTAQTAKKGASSTSAEKAKPTPNAAEQATASAGVQTPASKIRHEWYQTQDAVVVSLFAKGVPKDTATIDIQERSLAISFPLATGSDYDFSLDPLFGHIDAPASTAKVMSTKIEFTLKKKQAGEMWPKLESHTPVPGMTKEENGNAPEDVKRVVLAEQSTNSGPSYPTSSRSGPKDWDKVVDELTKKPKKDKKEGETGGEGGVEDEFEGADPVNGFFQSLYSQADPDTKRAMMKSYQESNGTALSTNWAEVGKGKVETQPPDGMEAKPW
ncbi:MAG: hypothetical protein LQ344_005582 [Seirophora lacunosa]|nr:MAG: hypothetical protein LQ344_005582 [Seirophora lacunosa]